MYECPNCAGNLKFDIVRQQLYCEYCGTLVDPYHFYREKDAEETVISFADMGNGQGKKTAEYEVTVFTCPQCGGQIVSEDTTAATFCSFCGSSTILDSRISRERRPGYIIPFCKTKEDCRESYAKMMRRAVFAPKELKDERLIEKFRGIYMPYWVYSFEKKGNIAFSGRRSRRKGDYVFTNHYQLDCVIEEEYSGLAYDASASFSDNLSGAIAPFDLKQKKRFVPSFLSGFYADTNDVNQYVYRWEAEDIAVSDSSRQLIRDSVCRRYHAGEGSDRNVLRNALRPAKAEAELAMLPVWFLAYRNGDRVSYAVVNGQTGKVAADLPVDRKKYLLGSLLMAVPLFFLLNLFLTITPGKILLIAACLALLCILILNAQMNRIFARESGEDDKGLASVTPAAQESSVQSRKNPRRIHRSMGPWGKVGIILLSFYGIAILQSVLTKAVTSGLGRWYGGYRVFAGVVPILVFLGFGGLFLWLTGKMWQGRSGKRASQKRYFKEKCPVLGKPAAGIVAAVLIGIVNPVSDWFYYIGAFVCMGMVLWAILDIIKHHNLLTTRKLPQFNRRGGDELE